MHVRSARGAWAVGLAALVSSGLGCAGTSHTERSALVGGAIGSVAGTVVGHQFGDRGTGAVVGGATGLLAGAVTGHAKDERAERERARAEHHAMQVSLAAHQNALTNADVVNMTRSGLGEPVIVSTIRSRGGRFDTAPDALIALKSQGVGDGVIQAMMAAPAPPAFTPAVASHEVVPEVRQVRETVVVREPPVVVHEPPAVVHVMPRPCAGPPRRFRRGWHVHCDF